MLLINVISILLFRCSNFITELENYYPKLQYIFKKFELKVCTVVLDIMINCVSFSHEDNCFGGDPMDLSLQHVSAVTVVVRLKHQVDGKP
jgi:hypothetical protein